MSVTIILPPEPGECAPYYHGYVNLVPGNDLLKYFATQQENPASLLATLPEATLLYRYAEDKWSVKDVIQHLIDSERIFCYRALTFARADAIELPGFEENEYAAIAGADHRSAGGLAEDYLAARASTVAFFKNLDETQLTRKGVANKQPVTVRALGYMIAGHEIHHMNVIRDRYLTKS